MTIVIRNANVLRKCQRGHAENRAENRADNLMIILGIPTEVAFFLRGTKTTAVMDARVGLIK